jgi:hypothetical protein
MMAESFFKTLKTEQIYCNRFYQRAFESDILKFGPTKKKALY